VTAKKSNLPASVAARLLNRAKQTGDDYQILLTGYCFERFLYRLGASSVRDRFVLKGAMLLRLWSQQPYRATRDLDLLRLGDGSFDAIREDIQTICATPVEPDAVVFDAGAVRIEAIRPEDEYAGARTTLPARCGTARLMLHHVPRRCAHSRAARGLPFPPRPVTSSPHCSVRSCCRFSRISVAASGAKGRGAWEGRGNEHVAVQAAARYLSATPFRRCNSSKDRPSATISTRCKPSDLMSITARSVYTRLTQRAPVRG